MKMTFQLIKRHTYALRLLSVLSITVFLVEFGIMLFLFDTKPWQGIIDSLILIGLLHPLLYILAFRPLMRQNIHRKQAEEALRESEERYRDLFENANDLIQCINPQGHFLYVNQSWKKTLGYTDEDLARLTIYDLIEPNSVPHCRAEFMRVLKGEAISGVEVNFLTKDGRVIVVEGNISCRFEQGEPYATRGIFRDITVRKQVEKKLKEQKEFSENLIMNSTIPTFVLDSEHRVLCWNKACEELTGMKATEVLGTNQHWKAFYDYKRPCIADIVIDRKMDDLSEYYSIFKKSNIISHGLQSEGWFPNLGGRNRYVVFDTAPIYNSNGELLAVLETLQDFTERKRAEESIQHMAYHDPLTGLPNRMLFNDRIKMSLAQAKRNNSMLALLFLDLDNFKEINDVLGHIIGDQLLKGIAERLMSCMRSGDTIARLGGDEFTIILPQIKQVEEAVEVAQKIIEALREPWYIECEKFLTTTSIGIAIYPRDGEDEEALVRQADAAMYYAKEQRNQYHLSEINYSG